MHIGKLGRAAGVDSETIRYCERIGLLPKRLRAQGNTAHDPTECGILQELVTAA